MHLKPDEWIEAEHFRTWKHPGTFKVMLLERDWDYHAHDQSLCLCMLEDGSFILIVDHNSDVPPFALRPEMQIGVLSDFLGID